MGWSVRRSQTGNVVAKPSESIRLCASALYYLSTSILTRYLSFVNILLLFYKKIMLSYRFRAFNICAIEPDALACKMCATSFGYRVITITYQAVIVEGFDRIVVER